MCYLHRGFIREITSPTGSSFRGMTSLQWIRGEFRRATSTGSLSSRGLSQGIDGSYDDTTATIQRQTRDLFPPPPPVAADVVAASVVVSRCCYIVYIGGGGEVTSLSFV